MKSPISKQMIFETKLKHLFEDAKVDGAFVFYIPKDGEDVYQFDIGLCSHQLLTLGEEVCELAEKRIKEDEHE